MKNYALSVLFILFLTVRSFALDKSAVDNIINHFNYSGIFAKVTEDLTLSKDYTNFNSELAKVNLKGFITSLESEYAIQLGAFSQRSNAEDLHIKVEKLIENDTEIFFEDGYYKVRIKGIPAIRLFEKEINEKTSSELLDTISVPDTIKPAQAIQDTILKLLPIQSLSDTNGEKANTAQRSILIDEDNLWLRSVTYFGKPFPFVNALIITIMVSITTMITLLVIILYNRRRMEKEDRLHQFLMEKYQTLLIDYLFGNTKPEDFLPIASDTYRRQVLINQIIDISVNLKGEQEAKLLSLYKYLGLDRDSIKKAYDYRWHKKIKGFRELAFMNIKDANLAIYEALNSSNEILRMEAQIALVRLSDDDPFGFLSHLTRPFSLWEQITLHELLIVHDMQVPEFKKWLTSPNDTVVMFALRMIREFRQTDAEPDVKQAIQHQAPVVRHLAIQVAGDMGLTSTLIPMKRMYKSQENDICLEIVKSMGKMPDISLMGFLKLVLDKEDDVQLQIEATKAIENMGEEGVKALVKLMKSEYKNYNIIIRHVLDRRIY